MSLVSASINPASTCIITARTASCRHHLSPSLLLGCVEELYNTYPETVVYSIAADSFDYGTGLSPSVEATLPVLIDYARPHYLIQRKQGQRVILPPQITSRLWLRHREACETAAGRTVQT
jgi:hypothetical protein